MLIQLFQEQVRRNGNQPAIVEGFRRLSYEHLDKFSNALAERLAEQGLKSGDFCPLLLERSADFIIAVLGILKAGGVYVPINPEYPQKRIQYILEDIQAEYCITKSEWSTLLDKSSISSEKIFDLKGFILMGNGRSYAPERLSSDSPAYILYTSGSTGLPKGVKVPHRAIANLATNNKHLEISQKDIFSHISNICFDASTFEIWGSLLNGASLVIFTEFDISCVNTFHENAQKYNITHLAISTGLFHAWVLDNPKAFLGLKNILIGGDKLNPVIVKQLISSEKGYFPKIFNSYGPTEATNYTTNYLVEQIDDHNDRIPIGTPIQNVSVYVLDKDLNPLSQGEVGELHIGGVGLALGYHNRPELTAEKFIPNPFSKDSNDRLYKTGDLVRELPDGNLDFIGRIDHQVKIRGFRIELGEIQHALQKFIDIDEAFVLVKEDEENSHKQLVAYFIAKKNEPVDKCQLRDYLKNSLPDYMVPALFIQLKTFPLTSNGKVDREALLKIDDDGLDASRHIKPAISDKEKILLSVWSHILGIKLISVNDNFFMLGGDSILVMRVIAKAQEHGLYINASQFFKYPTIEGLANTLESTIKEPKTDYFITEDAFELTAIQRWFFNLDLENKNYFHQVYEIQVSHDFQISAFKEAFDYLLQYHDALRLSFIHQDTCYQRYTDIQDIEYIEQVDCSQVGLLDIEQVNKEAKLALESSLDIQKGIVCRAMIVTQPDLSYTLSIAIHHLVIDGISWRIILDDLERLYTQACRGEALSLPEKVSAWQSWCQEAYQYSHSEILLQEYPYWRNTVDSTALLPRDYESEDNTEESHALVHFKLNKQVTDQLLYELSKSFSVELQINAILLSALLHAVYKLYEKNTISLDLEGHGRESVVSDLDASRTVGWFTAVFPVLLELDSSFLKEEDIEKLLLKTHETINQIPNKGVGYGIIKYLSLSSSEHKDLNSQKTPSIRFNYLGQFDEQVSENRVFKFGVEPFSSPSASENKRTHDLVIESWVSQGIFCCSIQYSNELHQRETVESLAKQFKSSLEMLGDFPEALDSSSKKIHYQISGLSRKELASYFDNLNDIESIYPLTSLQEGLLYHSLKNPESPAYFEQYCWGFEGSLDLEKVQEAWKILIQETPIFRSGFFWENLEKPLQAVFQEVDFQFSFEDWRTIGQEQRNLNWQDFLDQDKRNAFDLNQASPMRVKLIQFEDGLFRFIWSCHHVIVDGWTAAKTVKRSFEVYENLLENRSSEIQKYSPPFLNYLDWLRKQDQEKAKHFWSKYFDGYTKPSFFGQARLPDKTPSDSSSIEDAESFFLFEKELLGTVQNCAKNLESTFNSVCQVAWAYLISIYTNTPDVVFGTTISVRPPDIVGVDDIFGILLNTLPIRCCLEDNESIAYNIQKFHKQWAEIIDHSYLSLNEITACSGENRNENLFNTLFTFVSYPLGSIKSKDFSVSSIDLKTATHYPMTVIVENSSEFSIKVLYNKNYFTEGRIESIIGHFINILSFMAKNTEKGLNEVTLLGGKERKLLLEDFNATETSYPENLTVDQLIEAQALKTPHNVALAFEKQTISYESLNLESSKFAACLNNKIIDDNSPVVAICMEKSIDLLVAVLGVLKAGYAYLPIDPSYPDDRIAYILEDTQAPVLIAQENLKTRFSSYKGHIMLPQEADAYSGEAIAISKSIDDLAYVIYTSGSTGRPKGVKLKHRGLVNRLLWMKNYLNVSSEDLILHKTSISFDVSVWELFLPLITGARLVIAPEGTHRDPYALAQLIENQSVSILHFVPSMLDLFLDSIKSESCGTLRCVVSSGEALKQYHIQKSSKKLPAAGLYNLYGPTEATIDVSAWSCSSSISDNLVSIGKAIDNTQLYVLDRNRKPTPIGVLGELCIGGIGLAEGYWNKPELTHSKFIDIGLGSGSRIYCTGDYASFLEDGNILYHGRLDTQIKLRGYRIELGEIERLLMAMESVENAAVLVESIDNANECLVAYLTLNLSKTELVDSATRVSEWEEIYDNYFHIASKQDPLTNFTSWNSSYTGQLIPEEEMLSWAEETKERILSLKPDSVFEIGCGSGLFLFRLLPKIQQYHGIDPSKECIRYVNDYLKRLEIGATKATVCQASAMELDRFKDYSADTVVLNSVAQYFPSLQYLDSVFKYALEYLLKDNGSLFLGDIRNFELLEEFHRSVVTCKKPQATPEEIQRQVNERIRSEKELLISPSYFLDLRNRFSQIKAVEILPKLGDYDNELKHFRYDVIVHVEDNRSTEAIPLKGNSAYSNEPLTSLQKKPVIENIKNDLKTKLPDYMVPNSFVVLEKFPVNSSGKTDKQALKLLDKPRNLSLDETQRETSLIEQKLLHILEELLQISGASVFSNFFDLGGHSLIALRFINKIQSELAVHLSVRSIFDYPTIESLSNHIRFILDTSEALQTMQLQQQSNFIIPLQKEGDQPPLFLIHPLGGTVFWFAPLAKYVTDRPLYGIEDPGIAAKDFLFDTLEEMALYYIEAIRKIQPKGPYHIGGASFGATASIAIADALQKMGEEVAFVGLLDGWAIYPEVINNEAWLKESMTKQYADLQQQLVDTGIKLDNPWFDLFPQRNDLINNYAIPEIKMPITLFKANKLIPDFEPLQNKYNNWHRYAKNITVESIPGDHLTMYELPNVYRLGEKLRAALDRVKVEEKVM